MIDLVDFKMPYIHSFSSMSTKCSLQIYAGSIEQIQKTCFEVEQNTYYLEKKYNFYDEKSYLNTVINKRAKPRVKLDSQSATVLKEVKLLSQKVNNLFDISVGTYKHCYTLKDKDELKRTLEPLLKYAGENSWQINNRFIEFIYPQTKLDLGGVIKEYAVDEAVRILKKNKITSAIVNFGGDLYALGCKQNGEPFTIGIKNPKDKTKNLLSVHLQNQALTTSANYERSYKIEDEEFSHILSKRQNQKEILSSTAISESVLKSGIYSTSFMIDTDIEITEDLKVILIDKDLKIHHNLS